MVGPRLEADPAWATTYAWPRSSSLDDSVSAAGAGAGTCGGAISSSMTRDELAPTCAACGSHGD
jgi:hypothetical protein